MSSQHQLPSVGVVISTHNRPELLRRALASVRLQDYGAQLEIVVVFDRSEPMHELAGDGAPAVRVVENTRTAGLAGARNTGILLLDTDLVAFCDDDDTWLPGKLAAQVDFLQRHAEANFITTAMVIDYRGRRTVRRAGRDEVTLTDLIRARMTMLHSSSFLFRREAMVGPGGFGLVSEEIPRSQGEDWDLLLRAARQQPIAHLDEPLVAIQWGGTSYFIDAWQTKNDAHCWLLEHHPEMWADRRARGILLGKLAFGQAALGDRRAALRTARRAAAANWHEPRVPLAVLVAGGFPARWITEALNKRGHGV